MNAPDRPDLNLAALSEADVLAIATALERRMDHLGSRRQDPLRGSAKFQALAARTGTLALAFRFAALCGTTYRLAPVPPVKAQGKP